MIYFIMSLLQNIPISTAPKCIAVTKRYTVGAVIKRYTVGAVITRYKVGAVIKRYTIGAVIKRTSRCCH